MQRRRPRRVPAVPQAQQPATPLSRQRLPARQAPQRRRSKFHCSGAKSLHLERRAHATITVPWSTKVEGCGCMAATATISVMLWTTHGMWTCRNRFQFGIKTPRMEILADAAVTLPSLMGRGACGSRAVLTAAAMSLARSGCWTRRYRHTIGLK